MLNSQWPIGYGVGLRIKRSSVWIRPWPLHWVLGQGSLLPLSQGEAFTLASISYLAILVKYILAKKKKEKKLHTYQASGTLMVQFLPNRDVEPCKRSTGEMAVCINGEPTKLLGFSRHDAHPQYGASLNRQQWLQDLQILQDLGGNYLR